ncbi:aminotransferase class I/II-fold pyridoxal phosphate-dependent enzyme [Marivirga harenae]|uniref:pyridoxal phosphate-dependent aminotransferase n=1 Tax=Marivirga harenae TaxID=2010992 RepID=UPI0026E077C5|nr:aminotransferase class I/II-fold pyridoxal phosphate-dependent enzyme [Marivirga harenae]WKV11661.1 aminotransferase class I/II-fold pyridoxal phosphate-dependent enzyme [Marivirga harenae]|tara:strand:- start:167702 stop:168862 length:1161 start_codon:yes stop_codon:yes gene_type:complete
MIDTANRIKGVEEYYFSKKLREVSALDNPDFPVINLGIGSPDLAPHKQVVDALNQSAIKHDVHAYQSYRGIPELRNAIADYYLKYFEVELSAEEEILPLVGSKEGIMHITQAFVNSGDTILVPNPGYPTYAAVGKLVQANIQYYNLAEGDNWQIDIDSLKKLELNKVKLLWLNSPHMPSGVQYSVDVLQQLVELAKEHRFLIVNDNPYSMILNKKYQSIMSLEGAKDVAIELNSLSKSHNMAGWRIGWCMGNSAFLNAILKVKSNMDSGMFKPLQLAATAALKLEDKWFDDLNEIYQQRRILAEAILKKLGCTFDEKQQGLFIWAKLPPKLLSSANLIDQLLNNYKIFLTPGFIFGTQGEGYIRISLCATESQYRIALDRLQNFAL